MTAENDPISPSTKHARKLLAGGLICSVAYIMLMVTYAMLNWDLVASLDPNEIGDFLAGTFAPLAFLWLVLGFKQQGDELQNSARALWLQSEELRNSVEQQRQLVEVTREQLAVDSLARAREDDEAERAAQPKLMLGGGGGTYSDAIQLQITLTNGGPTCTELNVIVSNGKTFEANMFGESNVLPMRFSYVNDDDVHPLSVIVEYTDVRGNRRSQSFEVPVQKTAGRMAAQALEDPSRDRARERCRERRISPRPNAAR
jgi:hypothetical protein